MLQRLKGKNILQITHKDLDGAGCSTVAYHYLNIPKENVVFVSNTQKDTEILKGIDDLRKGLYDALLITDISPSDKMLSDYLQAISDGLDITLIDHHVTAKHLSEIKSHKVIIEQNGVLTSGTSLLYDLFVKEGFKVNNNLRMISETIRRYDTWDWVKLKDNHAKELNMLFYILGKDDFFIMLKSMVKRSDIIEYNVGDIPYYHLLNSTEKMLVSVKEVEIKNYVASKLEKVCHASLRINYDFHVKNRSELNFVYVLAENHINDVASALYSEYDVDFVAVISFDSVSLRTNKEDVDLSLIAKFFGGGGHSKASGFSVPLLGAKQLVYTSFGKLIDFN